MRTLNKIFAYFCICFCLCYAIYCVVFYANTILSVFASEEMAKHEESKAVVSCEALEDMPNVTKTLYSDENLELLAHLIQGEAGSD